MRILLGLLAGQDVAVTLIGDPNATVETALIRGLGLVAAPCIGPFIVTLLAFVGASGSPVLGFWMFFVLALGMGLPFLVLGILELLGK